MQLCLTDLKYIFFLILFLPGRGRPLEAVAGRGGVALPRRDPADRVDGARPAEARSAALHQDHAARRGRRDPAYARALQVKAPQLLAG